MVTLNNVVVGVEREDATTLDVPSLSQNSTPTQPLHNLLPSFVVAAQLASAAILRRHRLRFETLLHLGLDVAGQGEEGFLHVDRRLGGCFHEFDAVLDRQFFALIF